MIRRLCCTGALVAALVVMSVPPAQAATSPSTWATKFCTAFHTWQKTVTAESAKANEALDATSGSDLGAIREGFVSFLANDVAATKAAIRAIEKAGAPSATNGRKIQAKVVGGFQAASNVFAGARTNAAVLSTTDPVSFVNDATKISSDLNGAGDSFGTTFSEVETLDKDGTLGKAIATARACKFLKNQ